MTSPHVLYLSAMESISPIGVNNEMTNAMISAEVSTYGEIGYYNSQNYPIMGAKVPDEALQKLKDEIKWSLVSSRQKRLLELGAAGLENLLTKQVLSEELPLFLAGPEVIPGTNGVTPGFLSQLVQQTEAPVDLSKSRYFANGRSGVLEAIAFAFNYLEMSNEACVLIGGVDTYIDPLTLGALDKEERLLSEASPNAFAPSEAASFMLISRNPSNNFERLIIHRPGIGREPGHRFSDTPYMGDGLDEALKAAVSNTGISMFDAIYSSMNGEHFFAKEYGVATMRSSSFLREDFEHLHPVDCFGDVGAATGAMLISYAAHNFQLKLHQNPVIVCCSSDQANRSAVCLDTLDRSSEY